MPRPKRTSAVLDAAHQELADLKAKTPTPDLNVVLKVVERQLAPAKPGNPVIMMSLFLNNPSLDHKACLSG